ncbi:MAG: serine/threonine-protein kinase [Myxococcota bacterium]
MDVQGLATLFERLCDAPEPERASTLAGLPDGELKQRLVSLLEADRVASRVLGTAPDAGAARVLAMDLAQEPVPLRIGRFRILRELGSGAMGVVYEAEQDHPRRRVALKRLHPWLQSDLAVELFRFEAQALGQVSHPSIPVVFEAGEADGTAYLTMERVEGVPLLEWVHRTSASLEARVDVLVAIAEAAGAAHRAGLVHRDLKPQNILVTDEGVPKLLDFGVAAPLLQRHRGTQPGTPPYMSPEQLRGEPVDARSDLHALGTIAYELLVGRRPVPDGSVEELARAKSRLPERADVVDPRIDVDVARVVERALEPDPSKRHERTEEWAEDLRRAAQSLPLSWVAQTPRYRAQRFVKRNRRGVVGLFAVAGLVAAVATGFAGRDWLEHRTCEAEAENRRLRTTERATEAVEAGDADGAERILRAFVTDPDHRGTRAQTRAWLWWAGQVEHLDRKRGPDALAEAWLSAPDPEMADEVGLALAHRFARDGNWSALWGLRDVLSADARERVSQELFAAAVARRDFATARAMGGPDDALLRELGTAVRVGSAHRAGWIDADGDGSLELFTVGAGLTVLSDALGRERAGGLDQSGAVGWLMRNHYLAWDHRLWVAQEDEGGRLLTATFTPDGLRYEPFASTLPGRVLDLELAETPWGPRFLVGMGYPHRGILTIDAVTGERGELHPATDALKSDVMDLLVADLDGDGDSEVVVALGAWYAHEVRVLTPNADGYTLAGRLELGTVQALELLERPGEPLIVASKADLERNLRVFPPDAPFGPEAGIYLLRWTGDALEEDAFLPMPIEDGLYSSPERGADLPTLGDFDGDGTVDLMSTLRHFDLGVDDTLWLVSDLLGSRRSHLVAGLQGHAAHDLDGDGDDELLVGDPDNTLWVLGLHGDDVGALPTWDLTDTHVTLGPSPSDDPVVRRAWGRAEQLVSLGLVREATAALAVLPGLARQPEVQGAAYASAARLLEAAHDPSSAERMYAAALEKRADPGIAAGLVRTKVARLDLEGARALDAEYPGEVRWLAGLPPARTLLDLDTLDPWSPQVAGVFQRQGDALHIEAFNDSGVLATRQVEVTGPVAMLELDATIETLELGAGLAVDLVGGEHRRELVVAMWGQGGGGTTKLYQHCGGSSIEHIGSDVIDHPVRVTLAAGSVGPEHLLRCRTESELRLALHTVASEPIPPGIYTLRIRTHGVPDYMPPTRFSGQIHSLRGVGIEPVSSAVSSPEERARYALFEGRVPDDIAPAELAWAALAAGDAGHLESAIRERWAAGDRVRLRWLLRGHSGETTALLERVLGPDFPALFFEAYSEPGGAVVRSREVEDDLLRPRLDSLALDLDGSGALRVWRAEIWRSRGERARARVVAASVAEHVCADCEIERRPELRAEAWELVADLSTGAERDRALAEAEALRIRARR